LRLKLEDSTLVACTCQSRRRCRVVLEVCKDDLIGRTAPKGTWH